MPTGGETPKRLDWFWIAIGTAVAARLGAFVFLALWPIRFDPYKQGYFRGRLLSPNDIVGIDIEEYILEAERWADGSVLRHLTNYAVGDSFVPPLTPILMWLFDYGPGHAMPLALFWFALSAAWAVGWILTLARRGLSGPWLIVLGLLPTPIFYQFAVGTDLPFAVLFLAFYASYRTPDTDCGFWPWLAALLLLIATRSSSVSVVAFVFIDLALALGRGERLSKLAIAGVLLVGLVAATVHMSWLFNYMVHSMPGGALIDPYTFFGYPEAAYRAGLFSRFLPVFIDLPLSWSALLLAKTLYFCGFRPSFEATSIPGIVARTLPALVVAIPGLFWCLLRGEARDRVLVMVFLLPALGGLAQERYSLPILPLLLMYAARLWQAAFRVIARRRDEKPAPG